jgi:hypothetical protein
MRTTVTAVLRTDGMLDYTKEDEDGTMKTVVPPVFEKLEAQLESNNVLRAERDRFISDVNAFGKAVISFPTRRIKFCCWG